MFHAILFQTLIKNWVFVVRLKIPQLVNCIVYCTNFEEENNNNRHEVNLIIDLNLAWRIRFCLGNFWHRSVWPYYYIFSLYEDIITTGPCQISWKCSFAMMSQLPRQYNRQSSAISFLYTSVYIFGINWVKGQNVLAQNFFYPIIAFSNLQNL